MRSADRLEFKFKVAFDVKKIRKFCRFRGFCDVTGNFELDFRAIG